MSIREDISQRIADHLEAWGLNTSPSGVSVTRVVEGRKSYRSVSFGVARYLDGEVRVYGPSFVMVRTSRTGDAILPGEKLALDFIHANFASSRPRDPEISVRASRGSEH